MNSSSMDTLANSLTLPWAYTRLCTSLLTAPHSNRQQLIYAHMLIAHVTMHGHANMHTHANIATLSLELKLVYADT
jgi:hypothetical protein